ncbi:hypothetical protein C5167_018586 [Papaver somniferum]|uniref:Auxin-responsive protein n=1 Tax=Papaver somniferum TaxID=3469 RepID=A0A4Y7IR11_PAPSO|nr:auxin-responsive protein IAA18-like [Papaver somniferum]RZC50161.1 hypothetical protein C5167_018586 [Papaver somniferum]
MESGGDTRSGGGEISPQLLDLIPGWAVKGGGGGGRNFGGSEERKLELKLGPPGEEDWFINGNNSNNKNMVKTPLYLGGSSSSSKTLVNSTKRGFQDTIDEDTETRDNETWGKNKCSTSSSQHHHHQQQPQNSSFLRFPQQNHSTVPKDSSQNNDNNIVLSTPAASSGPANATITNTPSQKRTAPAPVVGWPPVRSFRRNLTKPAAPATTGSPNEVVPSKEIKVKPAETVVKKGLFVKINMDGVPIGRKVDLKAYDSYEKLSSAVDQLFRDLLAAQIDSSADLNCPHFNNEAKAITGLLDGSGEYTLVYEDNEGDRMLVGDVPWGMFATTVKRLRVLKTSELSTLHLGNNNSKQGKPPVETKVK